MTPALFDGLMLLLLLLLSLLINARFEFGSAVGGALSVGVGGGITRSNSQTSTGAVESSETTTVGFTVSDESIHDEFAVSIFIDPVYGTPIFVTTGIFSL